MAFKVTAVGPSSPRNWANIGPISSVTRSQGVSVDWTGDPDTGVKITGVSSPGTLAVSFTCFVPTTALTFTVPAYITQSLPAGTGTLTLFNGTVPVPFRPLFPDTGFAQVTVVAAGNVTFQPSLVVLVSRPRAGR